MCTQGGERGIFRSGTDIEAAHGGSYGFEVVVPNDQGKKRNSNPYMA